MTASLKTLIPTAAMLVLSTGCWMTMEKEMDERVETMEGHHEAMFEATAGLAEGDVDKYLRAMKQLEHGGQMPGFDFEAQLDELHIAAKQAKKASDPRSRAEALVMVANHCAACHGAHDVKPPPEWEPTTPKERAVLALIFHSDKYWAEAKDALGDDAGAQGWDARSHAVVNVFAKH